MSDANTKTTVGEFFRDARQDVDVTQAVAANEVGISVARLKQYEIGRVMPRLTTAYKLLTFYDVDWQELGKLLEQSIFPEEEEEIIDAPKNISSISKGQGHAGRVTNNSRTETKMKGQHIVMSSLEAHGWNVYPRKQANYDILAEKGNEAFRFKITSKSHKSKVTLCSNWSEDKPSFNRAEDKEKADFLVMVRFTEFDENECFLMTIDEAEKMADWMAEEIIKLGNKPMFLQAYVGGPRNSRFKFNVREVWEPYAENWKNLDVHEKGLGN
jgi:transcriptional regulator with XRE-family HTH domain